MKIKDNKGSITVFVLVGLLFMTSFLLISFGSNVNKSKSASEQLDILSDIYSHGDTDVDAYERAYTDIRRKNAQILTESSDNSSTLELTKTFTDTLSDYKIYGNSVQNGTPSPENPVEIQSVGNQTKNLLNYQELFDGESLTITGITYKKTNEGIIANGTATGWAATAIKLDLKPILEVGKTYVISGSKDNVSVIFYSRTNGTASYSASKTITGEEEIISVYLQVSPEKTANNVLVMPQLEEGTIATDYEPYGYKMTVKVSGNNLFNANAIKNTNIQVKDNGKNIVMPILTSGNGYTNTSTKLSDLCPDLEVGDEVILSFKSNTSTNPMIYIVSTEDLWYRNTSRVITQEMLDSLVALYGNRYMDGETVQKVITNFQIEKGTVATEYEPYVKSQTVNIFLDEPLRKVGDYEDYIDFENNKVVRKVGYVLKDSTDLNLYASSDSFNQFVFSRDTYLPGSQSYGPVLCSYMKQTSSANAQLNNVYIGYSNFNLCLDTAYTLDTLKELLNEKPMQIYYHLATPDNTETIELPELKTFEDYTKIEVLTSVAPSKIEVTYYGYTIE